MKINSSYVFNFIHHQYQYKFQNWNSIKDQWKDTEIPETSAVMYKNIGNKKFRFLQ